MVENNLFAIIWIVLGLIGSSIAILLEWRDGRDLYLTDALVYILMALTGPIITSITIVVILSRKDIVILKGRKKW